MISSSKHIFAINSPNFWTDNSSVESVRKVVDQELVHRLVKVLRIEVGQLIVFFDKLYHGTIEIVSISKKDIVVKILSFEKNSNSLSEIVFLLPLLKKEALEEAVYSLAEIGVSKIQLVVTQKSRQKLLHEKEFHRLEAIVIAAAEQSKNYVYPEIHMPQNLSEIKVKENEIGIVFDPAGDSFFDIQSKKLSQDKIFLLVGPEGGLTHEEVEHLRFIGCRLTSTVLRAIQAVAVGASLFRI